MKSTKESKKCAAISKKVASKFLILFITILSYPATGLTEVVNLIPIKDTFVNKAAPTASYGSRDVLRTNIDINSVKQTLIQFNLSGIPQNSLIINAELRLYSRDSQYFIPDTATRVYALLGSWSESTTWNTKPLRASSYEDSIAVNIADRYFEWDITNLVQNWIDGVMTNYGVMVRSIGDGNLFFKSSEALSRRPILHVEYTPMSYVGFGDSITRGSKDNITSDNISDDGRNSGGGYEPILNNLLTDNTGYEHTVLNEGVSGNRSINGVDRISQVLAEHPRSQFFLILLGTNDAGSTMPPPSGMGLNPGDPGYEGSFKDNMQQIIDAVVQARKRPYLAKVPILYAPCGSAEPFPNPDQAPENITIREYNKVIDELRAANGIKISAPKFYAHFRAHPEELADFCHPNGVGYQSMARLWSNALTGAAEKIVEIPFFFR